MEYKDVELTAQQIKLLKQLKRTDIAETLQNKADLTVLKKFKLAKCINTNEAFYRSIYSLIKRIFYELGIHTL